ncbi:hypothetical protein DSO57_1012832 [Entomophthora muscae]|uniref:Uncharacterized protein n=1 Tax=Entomophthora muscae TaxID=34485 RepID=A0ACC2RKQ0_9FUNG|nr:hypothetical protein DSO57_1012832 [Entomophthora muscae]
MTNRGREFIGREFARLLQDCYWPTEGLAPAEVQVYGGDAHLVIGKVLEEFAIMQAKYKLLTNHSPLLENDNSSKPVPGYNSGHTLGTGDQEPYTPSTLLHLPGELFVSGEAVVKSLACNDLDLYVDDFAVSAPSLEEMPVFIPLNLEVNHSVPLLAPVKLSTAPTCTPWLLTGLELMGLNVYFPRLSPVSSLWSPL